MEEKGRTEERREVKTGDQSEEEVGDERSG